MGAINVKLGMITQREYYTKSVRKWFKSICFLPRTTSDKIVRVLLGDMNQMLEGVAGMVDRQEEMKKNRWENEDGREDKVGGG